MAGKGQEQGLSKEAVDHLDVLRDRLGQLATGTPMHEVVGDIDRAFESVVREAARLGRRLDSPSKHMSMKVTGWQVVGYRLGEVRRLAGWSQADLATAMTTAGFSWKRITVAEVEAGKRRTSIEELLGIAAVFAVPAVEFLLPHKADYLGWPDGWSLDPQDVQDLILGIGGKVGRGGADWEAAARAARAEPGEGDWRPAKDLYRRRMQGYGAETKP